MVGVTIEHAALGATIRAWRERLSPAAAGLPRRRARRTSGLRREELAELAGISFDYLVRLEQGRATAPSAQVVASLSRALQLTVDERDHLYRLAGLTAPARGMITDHIPRGVHRVLVHLEDAAVAVFAADWQLVWWNRGWAALLGDPSDVPPKLRNFARDSFPTDDGGPHMSRWPVLKNSEVTEAAIVSDLRRATGRFPSDPRLVELIDELTTGNERFAHLWAQGTVAAHREDHKTVDHPEVGPIALDCDVLTDGDLELKIVVLTAQPDTEDESKLRLALVAGASGWSGILHR